MSDTIQRKNVEMHTMIDGVKTTIMPLTGADQVITNDNTDPEETLKDWIKEASEKFEDYADIDTQLEVLIKENATSIATNTEDISDLQATIEELESKVSEMETTISDLQDRISDLESYVASVSDSGDSNE